MCQIRFPLPACLLLSGLGAAVNSSHSYGQAPINQDAATQPSPGHATLIEQFRFYSLDLDAGRRDARGQTRDAILLSRLDYGLTKDLSLSLRTPVVFRRRSYDLGDRVERDQGVGDVTALVKWRFYQDDAGPVNTTRISLLGGSEIRTGDAPFTNDAYNPLIGLALTRVSGRHGLNANVQWTFTTAGVPSEGQISPGMSTADVFRYNGAYLYRLAPVEYSADTAGAWYAMLEANGVYETNGDNELLLSPGLMYEATRWALELSLQVPVWRDLDNRPETEYVLVAGLRFSW